MYRKQVVRFVHWEITSNCNLNCEFCYQREWPKLKRNEFVTDDKLLEVADELLNLRIKKITFSGGEPLLRINILNELISKFAANGIFLDLQTNGILLTDPELTKKFRKVYITYTDSFNDLTLPQGIEDKIIVDLILHKKNLYRLPDILNLIKGKNLYSLRLIPGYYLPADMKIDSNEVSSFLEYISKVIMDNPNLDIKIFHPQTWLTTVLGVRFLKIEHLYISPFGKIGIFPFLPTSNETIFKGDIARQRIEHIQKFFLPNVDELFHKHRLLDKEDSLNWNLVETRK